MSRSYAFLLPWTAVCLLTAGTANQTARPENAPAPQKTIKVGILHSLTGTLAISETALKDAELLAIEEINKAGGVLGRQIETIIEDAESRFTDVFPEKARKLVVKFLFSPAPQSNQLHIIQAVTYLEIRFGRGLGEFIPRAN